MLRAAELNPDVVLMDLHMPVLDGVAVTRRLGVEQPAVAMFLPFVILLVPFWTGTIGGDTLLAAGHLLMLPAMLIAMIRRLGDYTG